MSRMIVCDAYHDDTADIYGNVTPQSERCHNMAVYKGRMHDGGIVFYCQEHAPYRGLAYLRATRGARSRINAATD